MMFDRPKVVWVVLLVAMWASAFSGTAAEWPVSTGPDIALAAGLAKPGDTLVMRDGNWQDENILFSANGTAANPITLRAQTLGRVYLTGSSRLRITGNFLIVQGLTFTNGYQTSADVISFQDTSLSVANNCRVTDCAIIDYNPPNGTLDMKWISLYGYSNRVDNCYLRGKTNVGTTLVVWLNADNRPNYHSIDHNYFAFRPPLGTNGSNGGETIRVGTSDFSMNVSRTTVENNYFEQCNGDVEIISSKSCENIYRHNTFVDCEGALSLRHGNRSVVEGNYFFGNHKTNTGGVRICGEDHKVYNNYFQDLAGTSSRAPLAIMQGLVDSPLNGYFQVYRATVAFNTFVNCTNAMIVGLSGTLSGTSETTTLAAVDCTIANNIVWQPAGKIVDQRGSPPINLVWEGNILFGATLNIATNLGTLRIDPKLAYYASSRLWRPTNDSPALASAQGTYNFVTNDIEGQARANATKDIGCDETSLGAIVFPPLTAADVGPLWTRFNGTFLTWATPADIAYGTPLSASQLNASANAPGTFAYSPPAGTTLNVGTGQVLRVVFTPDDSVSFNVATQTVALNVFRATPVVTWTNPAAISFGTPLGAAQLSATANVAGALVFTPPAGTILNASNGQRLSVTFTPAQTNNYVSITRTVSLNVNKATPLITWPNPAAIEQGVALSAVQLNASANASGTFTYTPPLGTVLAAGSGQLLSLSFTPNDTANFNPATRAVPINVTVGGKTVPAITWPAPAPILFGTPLRDVQLNATASVPGTFNYTPAIGAVLPAGNQTLSVTFNPNDTLLYTTAVKTVPIDVALMTSNALLRVAYIVPVNRFAQSHAVSTLGSLVRQYQEFFADEMERNGFGRKTFSFETEPDGVTPTINVIHVPVTDSFLRGDLYGNRVLDAARNAGLPIGAAGQLWWLIAETHVEQPDGALSGGFDVGQHVVASPLDSGWAISGSADLALYQTFYQTNALAYDGYTVPEIGPQPLAQDISFSWFDGITLSAVSSAAVGAGLRSIGEAFGLDHDYRNDENFNGNLMGYGFSGIRGTLYPGQYSYNYCGLSYASALALSVNPFFNPDRLVTDLISPNLSISTSGARSPVSGLLEIAFNASDNQDLYSALLTWQVDSDYVAADEITLSGTSASSTFRTPYFNSQQTNRYTITVFDKQGNRRAASTAIYANGSVNHSPQPFIRVSPAIAGLGESIILDASDTFDAQHGVGLLEVEWDLDGDGVFDTEPTTDPVFIARYYTNGNWLVRARLTDSAGDVAVSAPVAVSVQLCAATLSPTGKSHGYGYSTGTVTVTSGPQCQWTVVNTNDWITIFTNSWTTVPIGPVLPGAEIERTNKLIYFTSPNPLFADRYGTLLINDKTFNVTQDAAICTFSLSPTNRFHGFGLGSNSFKVTTKPGCEWTVVNTNPWITLTSALGTNVGTATVNYSVTDNRTLGRRSGNIYVAGELFTVTQWGTNTGIYCEFVISPYARTHSENSETNSLTVSVSGGCYWSVVNTNSWITNITQLSGTNSTTFNYTVLANPSLVPRTGTFTVGDQVFTVIQQGCSYAITPSSRVHTNYSSDVGSVILTAGLICDWTVNNTNNWILLTSMDHGIGSNLVTYAIFPNPRGDDRTGKFTIAGHDFTVTQSGKPCKSFIDPEDSETYDEQTHSADVRVTAYSGCSWSAVSDSSWVGIVAGELGEGEGIVTYSVDANSGPARSATLTIAGQDYVVSQASGIRSIGTTDLIVGSGQTNSIAVMLNAHGNENSLSFSLCFDTNLLTFDSAKLATSVQPQTSLIVSNDAASGRVGLTVALLPGRSMPAGTGTTVQVFFRGAAVNGKPSTFISFCDAPFARRLTDAVNQTLSTEFENAFAQVIGFCSLGESLDAPQLNWTGGPIAWSCQTNVTHDGDDAAVSGAVPDNGLSYMETTLIGPGVLSFWWKVSSEPSKDLLRLYQDGSEQFRISGEVDWEWRTFNVPSGSHVMRWSYSKNSSGTNGSDRAWVDEVVYDPAPPSISTQPASQIVDAGATATFSVVAAGQLPLTYQWLSNNVALSDTLTIRGTHTATLTLSNVQLSQAGPYSVIIGSAQGNLASTNALLSVTQLLPLPEALDAVSYAWTNLGNAAWVGQSGVKHDGVDAGRSGNITHSQSSSFQTVLTGPGTVTFWWKVSSESSKDLLTFYINGSSQSSISGEIDWQFKTFTLGSGTQTLLWTYSKNSSGSAGQDHGWVDEFHFIPTPVAITSQPASQVVDQGGVATFTVGVNGTPPLTYQWLFNGTNLPGATGSGLSISNVQAAHAGSYAALVSNSGGPVLSSNAVLDVNRLVPLPEALDATNLVWTTNGTPPWIGQTAVTHDGTDAARSGHIADGGTTYFQTTVTGPGTVSFWWKVSSESGSDKLRFYVGGSEQENISGEVDWKWRSWTVASGANQVLKWSYTKGSSGSAGQDYGWVDQIYWVPASTPTPPLMAIQPTNRTVVAPTTVSFSAVAAGSSPLGYQWFFNGVAMTNGGGVSGATTTNVTLTSAGGAQAGAYSVVVTNSAGGATSVVALLTVITSPIITVPPTNQNVLAGTTVNFGVGAMGTAPMSYQWRLNGTNLANAGNVSGVTTTNLRLSSVLAAQGGPYVVVVSNSVGSVTSAVATLIVGTLPVLGLQPTNQNVVSGSNASFTATATGTAPLGYQWRINGTNLVDGNGISGATAATLTLSNVQASSAGNYSVVVNNPLGTVTSTNAALAILTWPAITTHPTTQSVPESTGVSFNVVATGTAPLTYRWRRNGTNLVNGGSVSGVSTATLTLSSAQLAQAGNYSVEVSNLAGVVVSSNALLTVSVSMTLGEAVNAPYLSWNTDVTAPWMVKTNITHDGEGAVQSGSITNSSSTWLETTVTGPGTIRFWWKVSSQTNADLLTFTVNGTEWASMSGAVDWQRLSFSLPGGPLVLRWNYSKDASITNGSDRGWLDEVDFVPTTGPSVPVIVRQPVGQDVDPGTTVTLSLEALGSAPLSYQWRFEGQDLGDSGNVLGSKSPTLTIFNAQAAQSGAYDVVVRNPYSIAVSDRAFLTVIPFIPLNTALDTDHTNLLWLTFGYSPWIGQGVVSQDRIDAAESGPLPNNQTNTIQTQVSGPGAISFWWKVSSETNHDRLRFSVDGVEMANISGEVDWRQRSFFIPSPSSTLRWDYTKDASGNGGFDRGWVDAVDFVPSSPIITNSGPDVSVVDQGTTMKFTVDASGTPPFSYQWRFAPASNPGQIATNLVNSDTNFPVPGMVIGAVGSHNLVISNVQPDQSGTYVGEVLNQAGAAISPLMSLTVIPALPLGTALNPNLIWDTGGYSWWVGTTNITHDGFMAARNGTLPANRSTYMRTTVVGASTLKFWWKASTETNADHLIFSINGVEQTRISGEHNWEQKVYDLNGVGTTYELRWDYSKNSLFTNGLDQVFVDEVVFAPVAPVITNQPVSQTVVDAGSAVTYSVAARGTPPFAYQWLFNGVELYDGANVSGATTATLHLTGLQVSQSGQYSVVVANDLDWVTSSNASLTVLPIFPLGDALDAANLTWSAGSPPWVGQQTVTHDGVDAARSPVIADNQTATMQTALTGPGTISFWWKVSCEPSNDKLIFYIGGTEQARISGETNWHQRSFSVPAGNQTLKWSYIKNGSVAGGQDRAWVDQLVFTPVPPTITTQPVSTNVDEGATATFNVVVSGTPPFTYQWRLDGSDLSDGDGISGANSATLVIANAKSYYAGTCSVIISNPSGAATSSNVTFGVTPILPLAVALDGSNLVWTTSGTPLWVGQGVVSHDGVDAARIASVPNSGSSSMQTIVNGPGTISFWWKVSSEPSNDKLTFLTNGTAAGTISGEVDWQLKTFPIGAGSQTLKWTYSKNSSTASGQDRAWVDQVMFGPLPPTITAQPTNQTVDAGSSATFSVTVGGTPPFTYQWQVDGVDINGATSSNLVLTGVQTWQAGNYRALISSSVGTAISTNATLAVFPILTLAEALDAPGFTWTTNGTPPWVGHGAVTHDGTDAARSGAVGSSGSTSMSTILSGPGTVSFWWKVSSETNNDKLVLYTNGTAAATISGEVDWQFKTFNLGAGSQTLTWTYSKNSGSTVAGQDRGWVDQFFFGPVPPTITTQPTNQIVDVGNTATFTVAASGTPPFTYQWQWNGVDLSNGAGVSGATSSNLVLSGVQTSQAGSYRVIITGTAGTATSSAPSLVVFPILTLVEALDTAGLTWTTNGTPPWVGHGAVTHDGTDAARSGAIAGSGSTSMSTILNGPGSVSFWWKVSSETNNDKLVFYTNGTAAATISGEVDWQFKTFNLGSGSQTLTWTYSKNSGSTIAGQDRGWVDQVQFGTLPPTIIAQPVSVIANIGGSASFTVGAAATPPIFYHWLFNGFPVVDGPGISGATNTTLTISNVQNPRVGSYSVEVSNSVGTLTSTNATLGLSLNVSLDQSLDGGLAFTPGGTGQPWTGQTAVTHDGSDAAQSGVCGDSTYTYFKTTVTGPNSLTFWWKISSELNHDYLRFMVDAVDQIKISGEVDWQQVTFNVPSGSHELQWRYSKNSSIAEGQDRAWVDQIFFGTNASSSLEAPSILIQPTSQTVDTADLVTLSVAAAGSSPLSYRWSCNGTNVLNGGNVSGATTEALSIANVLTSQAGNYSVIVSNGAGIASSISARLTVLPVIDLAEAIDAPELFIMTVGDAAWVGHTVVTHDGVDAARSGHLTDAQSATLETMVNGPGTLSFWWNVSSETNADTLTLSVNGVPKATISGESGWLHPSFDLPAGSLTLTWTYAKNSFGSAGSDRGWVDQVSFVPGGGSVTNTNVPTAAMVVQLSVSDNKARLTWEASSEKVYKVFYKDHLNDPEWTLFEGEVLVTWKMVDGQIVPNVVIATAEDVLAGHTRFYRVFEY